MNKKELYTQKYVAKTREWGARVDGLTVQLGKLSDEAKVDVQALIDAVHVKFAAAKATLDGVTTSSDEQWETLAERVDSAWLELETCTGVAYQAMRQHRPVAATKT